MGKTYRPCTADNTKQKKQHNVSHHESFLGPWCPEKPVSRSRKRVCAPVTLYLSVSESSACFWSQETWETLHVLSCPSQFEAVLSKPVASLGLSISQASHIPGWCSLSTFSADAHAVSLQVVQGERTDRPKLSGGRGRCSGPLARKMVPQDPPFLFQPRGPSTRFLPCRIIHNLISV